MPTIFDASTLAIVVGELQILVGGQVQRIAQTGEWEIVISLFKSSGGEKHLLLNCSPQWYRAHLTTRKRAKQVSPPPFCMTLRKYLDGGKISAISQREGDRILDLRIESAGENAGEEFLLSTELMGKHANIILVSGENKILHAAKLITSKQSRVRHVLPGLEYSRPPARPFAASPERGFANDFSGSAELDVEYSRREESAALEQARSGLMNALRKTLGQKSHALEQVSRGFKESARADEFQKFGDLILSQLHLIPADANQGELMDYFADGETIRVALDADLSAAQNAQKYFSKARRARESASELRELQTRLEDEIAEIETLTAQVENQNAAQNELQTLREKAVARGWLRAESAAWSTPEGSSGGARSKANKEANKPAFEGYKVRVFDSPDNFKILVGENASANDYLVTRLSKGSDWWLHLRGATSSHAIVQTQGAPERVPIETLLFAARLVVARSVAKHAGWAEVDYTLCKYVRKPRKAAPGSVVISHQKTLRVESDLKK